MSKSVKDKRRGKLRLGVFVEQDNAPVHIRKIAWMVKRILSWKCCRIYLIYMTFLLVTTTCSQNSNNDLRGKRYSDDHELTNAVHAWSEVQNSEFYRSSISDLMKRWTKF